MTKHKRSKGQLIQFITQYGLHIWAILIIANAALIYSYHFATHASTQTDTKLHVLDISPSIDQSPTPSPSPGPLGPTLQLQFSVPGIGSGGGTMKPLTPKRDVTVYLYAPDINSQDPTVKPLYTINSFALFDSNPLSPTYTSFLNPALDLGTDIKNGNYQIAFKTNLSFRTLIKQNPTDIGGATYTINTDSQIQIPTQTVLMGDIVPDQGDNVIDISDYNAFINCFGNRNTSNTFCKGHNYGDFNDDGIIDGIDYNILVRSLSILSQEGVAIPTLSPASTKPQITKPTKSVKPTPVKKTTVTPTANKSATTSGTAKKGGSSFGGIFFLFFLILLGGGGVFLYLKSEMLRNKINAIIHLSPTGTPSPVVPETQEEQSQEAVQPTEEPPAEPVAIPPTDGTIEKECYVKVKGPDEAGTGMWLTLTDDAGPVEAHYSKNDAEDGFAKAKGVMKTENGKTFFEISELTPEE